MHFMQNASAFADLSRGRRSAGLYEASPGRKGSPNDLEKSPRIKELYGNYEGVDSDLTT